MSNPLLEDIGNYLEEQGLVGGSSGWELFLGLMPPSLATNPSEQIIALFEVPGEDAEIVGDLSVEGSFDTLAFQVRGRSAVNDYANLRQQMQAIYLGLHQKEPAVVSGQDYIFLYAKTPSPLPMGVDEQQRNEMTQHYRCMRKR